MTGFPVSPMLFRFPSLLERMCDTVIFFFFFFFFFKGLHLWHMEVPRSGVKSELQLLACVTATATRDLSRICDVYHGSRQCQIFKPLSKARNQTHILMDASRICFCCTTWELPVLFFGKIELRGHWIFLLTLFFFYQMEN